MIDSSTPNGKNNVTLTCKFRSQVLSNLYLKISSHFVQEKICRHSFFRNPQIGLSLSQIRGVRESLPPRSPCTQIPSAHPHTYLSLYICVRFSTFRRRRRRSLHSNPHFGAKYSLVPPCVPPFSAIFSFLWAPARKTGKFSDIRSQNMLSLGVQFLIFVV